MALLLNYISCTRSVHNFTYWKLVTVQRHYSEQVAILFVPTQQNPLVCDFSLFSFTQGIILAWRRIRCIRCSSASALWLPQQILSSEIRALTALRRFTCLSPLMLRLFARLSIVPVVQSSMGIKMCQTPVFLSQLLLNPTWRWLRGILCICTPESNAPGFQLMLLVTPFDC